MNTPPFSLSEFLETVPPCTVHLKPGTPRAVAEERPLAPLNRPTYGAWYRCHRCNRYGTEFHSGLCPGCYMAVLEDQAFRNQGAGI